MDLLPLRLDWEPEALFTFLISILIVFDLALVMDVYLKLHS
jgi:hypothetical protein